MGSEKAQKSDTKTKTPLRVVKSVCDCGRPIDTLASNELLSRTESLRGKRIAKSKYCD